MQASINPNHFELSLHKLLLLIFAISNFILCNHLAAQTTEDTIADPYDRDTAYVGIMSRLLFSSHSTDTRVATEMAFIEFMKNIEKKCSFREFDNPDDVITQMQEHRLDAIMANPIDYLSFEHQIDPNYHYSLIFGDRLQQKILLLVRKSDEVENISQLSEKILAAPKGHQLGRIFLDLNLLKNNQPLAEKHFSQINTVNSLNDAIIDLFFHHVDAALVTDVAFDLARELNPQINNQIVPLLTSKPTIQLVIGINRPVPDNFKEQINQMVENIRQHPRTLHLLSLFKSSGVVRIDQSSLDPIREMMRDYQQLQRTHANNNQNN
ncbi:MAG: transporter substrate-binding domain-containing protein [Candidatus Thiodiazotropha sp. (ex Monitilora ramsayi)]|nr:transporter substrate-binding domain-containing protein [Candidatus Thiodiazotropha sp. (ex Monitilora ramsayi)]